MRLPTRVSPCTALLHFLPHLSSPVLAASLRFVASRADSQTHLTDGCYKHTRRHSAEGSFRHGDTYCCRDETRVRGGNHRVRHGKTSLLGGNECVRGGNECFDEGNNGVRLEEGLVRGAESSVRGGNDLFRLSKNHFRFEQNHFRHGNNYR